MSCPKCGLLNGEFFSHVCADTPMLPSAQELIAEIRASLATAGAEVDAAWADIAAGWDIEDRAFFEAEVAKGNGFKSALAMALHYIWKRDPNVAALLDRCATAEARTCASCEMAKETEAQLKAELTALRRQLAAIVETAHYKLLIECRDELADAREQAERLRVRLARFERLLPATALKVLDDEALAARKGQR